MQAATTAYNNLCERASMYKTVHKEDVINQTIWEAERYQKALGESIKGVSITTNVDGVFLNCDSEETESKLVSVLETEQMAKYTKTDQGIKFYVTEKPDEENEFLNSEEKIQFIMGAFFSCIIEYLGGKVNWNM